MLESYAVGVIAVVAMSVAWVGVQIAWRRVFPGVSSDPDVLAGRAGCQGCGCTEVCERRAAGAGSSEEEVR